MKLTRALVVVPMVLVALTGCAGKGASSDADEEVGAAREAALSLNALSLNALSLNALSLNALSLNALSLNALSLNALSASSLTALQDPSATGDLSRQLLKYAVGCALTSSQSVPISWTDASGSLQSATYVGQLGLAPHWASRSLTRRSDQELVSACLAARTNYFGVTVSISVRGDATPLLASTTAAELAAYPYVEGAFWGNLFGSTPHLSSCYDPANVSNSRAQQRVCATGYPDPDGHVDPCGIITLTGSCAEQCAWFDPWNQLYMGCGDSWNPITIGLQ